MMKLQIQLSILLMVLFVPLTFAQDAVEIIPPLPARPSIPSVDAEVDPETAEPPFFPRLRSSHPASQHGAVWVSQGPGPTSNGQVENVFPNNEVVGAVHVVLPHPSDENTIYLGGVNGGIWRTDNATHAQPTWVPLIDNQESLNIGAMGFDPFDPTLETLVAGTGRFSSFGSDGGARTGIFRTTDGGVNWIASDGGGILRGKNISAIAARGNTIGVAVDFATSELIPDMGIFLSGDAGQTFTQISGTNGLPVGRVFDLIGHPNEPTVFYAAVHFAGGGNGIYKSTNTCQNWVRVSNATMDNLIRDMDGLPLNPSTSATNNIEISVHDNGVTNAIYVAILNGGQLRNGGIFRSGDGGTTWSAMETPTTNEGATTVGTNPRFKPGSSIPGGQGAIHFDIEADPDDPFTVYVGGDRQPAANEAELQAGTATSGVFPNSIGAENFTGRLFRGDASRAVGSQWEHLTHDSTLGASGGGTLSNSAPHADCRDMAFRADGVLVQGDDGGIYVRTSPQDNQGDWLSINGTAQTTEFHDIAYDPVSNIVFGGAQDTGTPQQRFTDNPSWNSVSTADGGDVAVDTQTLSGFSWRYSSFQFLADFRRQLYDGGNNVVFDVPVGLAVDAADPPPLVEFVAQFKLNTENQERMVFAAGNGVYESLDQGDSLTRLNLTTEISNDAMAYGGRSGGAANEEVLYVGSVSDIFIRTAAANPLTISASPFPGGNAPGETVRDIVLDPFEWQTAFAIDSDQIFMTLDTGASWIELTSNLTGVGLLRTVHYIPSVGADVLVVGTDLGVFFSRADTGFFVWSELGTNLPGAPVLDMEYVREDDVLVVGTLGRGAWTVNGAALLLSGGPIPNAIWADFDFTGNEQGTESNPFDTIQEAIDAVVTPGTSINIFAGQFPESIAINEKISLNAIGGTVRIGAP